MQKQSTSPSAPLSEPIRFAVVGPGKVGLSLCRLLLQTGHRLERFSARRGAGPGVAELPPERWLPIDRLSTEDLDLLLITVSDPAIEPVARRLAQRPQAAVVLHTAGRFDAGALKDLRRPHTAVGSLHPLRAFSRALQPEEMADTWFAIDGDPPAQSLARRLVASWSGQCAEVTGDRRAAYHLAATLAAGGVVTLLAVVEELTRCAGLPEATFDAYLGLTRGALAPLHAGDRPAGERITGPAARGDHQALAEQRRTVEKIAPHLLPLIEELQKESLRQCLAVPSPRAPSAGEIPAPSKSKTE